MKKLLLLLRIFLLLLTVNGYSQDKEGKIVVQKFLAHSIQNNKGDEDPLRQVSIYLPPGYEENNQRFPTIYFLHGVGLNDSLMFLYTGLKELMDKAISSGRIHPMILVMPNSDNRFRGSFYTNSTPVSYTHLTLPTTPYV